MKKEITQEEYTELKESELELMALNQAGVDNWEGYDSAMEILRELKENIN